MLKTIICNICVSGKMFQIMNEQYNNPFIWCLIANNDYFNLIKNFDYINFNNIECKVNLDNKYKNTVTLILDNIIKLNFIHHHIDEKYQTITKIKNFNRLGMSELFYKDMLNYVKTTFLKRTQQMNKNNIVFLFISRDEKSDSQIFCNINTKYQKILVANDNTLKSTDDTFFIRDSLEAPTGSISKRLLDAHKNLFI